MIGQTQDKTSKHQRECDQGGHARAEACGSLSRKDVARFSHRLRGLGNLLHELVYMHDELLEVLQHKLVAMR